MKPVSRTAFYTAGVRMLDAAGPRPVCGDTYARVFMDDEALNLFERFKSFHYPNISNVYRHRIIDDLVRDRLRTGPNLRVVLIGAGFDSRAYRLDGGRWFEVDEPQLIAYKNERLPVEQCGNPLARIAIDFAGESLDAKLEPLRTGEPTLIIVEGVFMYLEQAAICQLHRTLHALFPNHSLICDLMTRTFFDRYSQKIHEAINGIGASFRVSLDAPERLFEDGGYRISHRQSIVATGVDDGGIRIPRFLLNTFLKSLRDGYTVFVFESRRG